MRGANFVSFITVIGFMTGIVFALLKSNSPGGLLIYTLLITVFFYLFAHVSVAFYFRTFIAKAHYFPKAEHERDLDIFVREINKRERYVDTEYNNHAVQNVVGKYEKAEQIR